MAEFTPSKKTAQDFNNGIEYINEDVGITGDAVQAETINNLVESALYTQEQAESAARNASDAVDIAEEAKEIAEDAQKGVGTKVSVNGKVVADFNADTKLNKSGDQMNGSLTMTGQSYPNIIFQSSAPSANGKTVFLEQQNNGTFMIIGRTANDANNNRYAVKVPESNGTIALIDASGKLAVSIIEANELYENTHRVYSPNNPNTQLIYNSNVSITIPTNTSKVIYRFVPLKNGDIVHISGYLGSTSATGNIVNIMFPVYLDSVQKIQYTGIPYKTTGGYTSRFEIKLGGEANDTLMVSNVKEYQPNNAASDIAMTITYISIRRFSE